MNFQELRSVGLRAGWRRCVIMGLCLAASRVALGAVASQRPPPIRIAYFTPSDREPLSNRVARIGRTMEDIRLFYREGMEAAGYGPLTFELERDEAGQIRLHEVRGRYPMEAYGRNDAAKVRAEVKEGLAAQGVDIDREVVVIFQVLLKWEEGRAFEIGPFVGGGNGRTGTAWVYDDELLDAARLDSTEPGGYYGRPCSIGQFNTHYVGGVAHELGHAFGLPHDRETTVDRQRRGISLMGGGNHTYGRERRGQGLGSFLSPVSAMRLRYSRSFAGDLPTASERTESRIEKIEARFEEGRLALIGRITGHPRIRGLAAYDDLEAIRDDYDAIGWVCDVADDGQFRLELGELRPGRSQLRIVSVHANGGVAHHRFDYTVDASGKPDVAVFRYALPLKHAVDAFAAGDRAQAETRARDLMTQVADAEPIRERARHLLALLNPEPPRPLTAIPPGEARAMVSRLVFDESSVGWGRLLRDQVPEQVFPLVGGVFYASALYAHAPSRLALNLGGGWKQFRSGYGLQDHTSGSVVFVVRGDGRDLYRSGMVRDHQMRKVDLDVTGIDRLELIIEDGGDGRGSDWGMWLVPSLDRDPQHGGRR